MTARVRRGWLVALGIIAILATSLVLIWFVALPKLIEIQLKQAFEKVQTKTGRQLSVDGIRLAGPQTVVLRGLRISDLEQAKSEAVYIGQLRIKLDRIPTGEDFRIAELAIYDSEITLRYDGKTSNYDDIIKLLKAKPKGESTQAASKWRSYVTPLPELKIENLHLAMPSISIKDGLDILDLRLVELNAQRSKKLEGLLLNGMFKLKLAEDGKENSYQLPLSGKIESLKNATLNLAMPKTAEGKQPDIFSLAGYEGRYESISLVLPSTMIVNQASLSHQGQEIASAQVVRAQFMTMPPQKVSGIYFKEVELVKPKLKLSYQGDELPLADLFKAIGDALPKGEHDTVILPKERPTPRDHFFTQRLFIDDAQIALHDTRPSAQLDLVFDSLSLEMGYRSIRKCLDYQLDVKSSKPIATELRIEGRYTLNNDDVWTKISMPHAQSSESLNLWLEQQKTLENLPLVLRFLTQFDFRNTTLALELDTNYSMPTKQMQLKGSTDINGLEMANDSISNLPLPIKAKLTFEAEGDLETDKYTLKQFDILAGQSEVKISGSAQKQQIIVNKKSKSPINTWAVEGQVEVPSQNAQELFESVPHGLRQELDGLSFEGMAGLKLTFSGNLAQIANFSHQIKLSLSDDFGISAWPSNRNIQALNNAFIHDIRDPNALNEHQVVIPPSIYPINVEGKFFYTPSLDANDIRERFPDWVLFEDLNPWLIQLITTTEDGSFFSHQGFSPLQIKAAIEKNIARGSFYRGASTLSMQLIKNLYFDRSKSISRKLQEILYTWLLETVVNIPKQRIMELYFNIIEFGPEIYGIQEAAKYYFGKQSADLTLKESAFLMAIIPNPRRGELYRNQQLSEKNISRTIDFYISEMIRRKCNPDTLRAMQQRYSKRDIPMPYAPCCPPADSLQLMRESALSFYLPDPSDPLKYDLRPDLYNPDGNLLTPKMRSVCQNHMSPEIGSIFESFSPDEMPIKEELF